jgi:hypothetical protein
MTDRSRAQNTNVGHADLVFDRAFRLVYDLSGLLPSWRAIIFRGDEDLRSGKMALDIILSKLFQPEI